MVQITIKIPGLSSVGFRRIRVAGVALVAVFCGVAFAAVPYTFTGGEVLSAAKLNANFDAFEQRFLALTQSTETVVCKYSSLGFQVNIPNDARTVMTQYRSKEIDTHNAFNATTGIFTAPFSGTYMVTVGVQWAGPNASGQRAIWIRPSAGFLTLAGSVMGNASIPVQQGGSGLFKLAAGQTLWVEGYQNSGAALATTADGGGNYFQVVRVSD